MSTNMSASLLITGFILAVFALSILLGNILIIAIYLLHPKLQSVTNCFLMSLASSDVLLSVLVLPFAIKMEVSGTWRLGWLLCDIWVTLDVFLCTASILNLCCISLDRYLAIIRPLWYKARRNKSLARKMITVVWLVAFLIACPPVFGWREKDRGKEEASCSLISDNGYIIYSAVGSFFLPMLLMAFFNISILVTVVRQGRKLQNQKLECHSRSSSRRQSESLRLGKETLLLKEQRRSTPKCCLVKVEGTRPEFTNISQELVQESLFFAFVGNDINIEGIRKMSAEIFNRKRKSQRTRKISMSLDCLVPGKIIPRPRSHSLCNSNIKNSSSEPSLSQNVAPAVQNTTANERRTAKKLFLIVGCFLVCWVPFFLLYTLAPFCPSCNLHPMLFKVLTWVGYSNSLINPIIYAYCNSQFRKYISHLRIIQSKTSTTSLSGVITR